MKLKQLFEDDGAVSPVIGVILMVAITVILAAVIGTFVLGLGDRVSEASPNAQFSFEYNGPTGADTNEISITHDGGDGVTVSQLDIKVAGTLAWDGSASPPEQNDYTTVSNGWSSDKITAGDELVIGEVSGDGDDEIADGNTVKVIWTADGSDKTAVIGESEVSL